MAGAAGNPVNRNVVKELESATKVAAVEGVTSDVTVWVRPRAIPDRAVPVISTLIQFQNLLRTNSANISTQLHNGPGVSASS